METTKLSQEEAVQFLQTALASHWPDLYLPQDANFKWADIAELMQNNPIALLNTPDAVVYTMKPEQNAITQTVSVRQSETLVFLKLAPFILIAKGWANSEPSEEYFARRLSERGLSSVLEKPQLMGVGFFYEEKSCTSFVSLAATNALAASAGMKCKETFWLSDDYAKKIIKLTGTISPVLVEELSKNAPMSTQYGRATYLPLSVKKDEGYRFILKRYGDFLLVVQGAHENAPFDHLPPVAVISL